MKEFKMKKLLALFLCIAMALVFTACSGGGSEEEGEAEGGEEPMTIVAVTEATYPPFESTDEDGNIVGFDIDLINAIAEDQGFVVEMQNINFDALIPTVESHQADMIIAGISENPERAEHVAFTDPYYNSGNFILVLADSGIDSEEDIPTDAKIGCQTGTTCADYVQNFVNDGKAGQAVILDQTTTIMLQLDNGDIQAFVGDKPVLDEYVAKGEGKYKIVGHFSYETGDGLLKMAVAKDNPELLEKLNTGLKNIMANGKYKEICDKWGIGGLEEPAE